MTGLKDLVGKKIRFIRYEGHMFDFDIKATIENIEGGWVCLKIERVNKRGKKCKLRRGERWWFWKPGTHRGEKIELLDDLPKSG